MPYAAAVANLATINRILFARSGVTCSTPVPEPTNLEYGALVHEVGGVRVRSRVGRVTPKKVGFFVAVWRRTEDGSTQPLASEDGIDLLTVSVGQGSDLGQFVMSRQALVDHGIVSQADRGGKRGFRVYPPWSAVDNAQARQTQTWQREFFLHLGDAEDVDLGRARVLYGLG